MTTGRVAEPTADDGAITLVPTSRCDRLRTRRSPWSRLRVHRAIEAALDPVGLLNPGKVFRCRS